MAIYRVTIYINAIDYAIEAENEDEAILKARDYALQESHYDILKWADYDVQKEETV